eukprot:2094946-Lingulodinium_polyedra.AAC.1
MVFDGYSRGSQGPPRGSSGFLAGGCKGLEELREHPTRSPRATLREPAGTRENAKHAPRPIHPKP